MPVSMETVQRALLPDEPDYASARELGPEALPFLRQLVTQGGSILASKAAYLAGMIGTEAGGVTVAEAARSPEATIRVAAAGAAKELEPTLAAPILSGLMSDNDRGVRHRALKSAATRLTPELKRRVEQMADRDRDPLIRKHAAQLLRAPASR